MGDHVAFFYGTLMAPAVLFRVCHGNSKPAQVLVDLINIRPAVLHGHERRRVVGMDYPGMIPSSPSSSVRGTVVTGLTDGDIWRLDIFEGSEYTRQKVKVRVLEKTGDARTGDGNVEGEELEAETYIWTASGAKLENREWDFAEFQSEKMRYWVSEEGTGEYAGRESFLGLLKPCSSLMIANPETEVDEAVRDRKNDGTGGRGMDSAIAKVLEQDSQRGKEILGSAV